MKGEQVVELLTVFLGEAVTMAGAKPEEAILFPFIVSVEDKDNYKVSAQVRVPRLSVKTVLSPHFLEERILMDSTWNEEYGLNWVTMSIITEAEFQELRKKLIQEGWRFSGDAWAA